MQDFKVEINKYCERVETEYKTTMGPNLRELVFWARFAIDEYNKLANGRASGGDSSYLKKKLSYLESESKKEKKQLENIKTIAAPEIVQAVNGFQKKLSQDNNTPIDLSELAKEILNILAKI